MSNLNIEDFGRIRRLTLCREQALNAFDNALYFDLTNALVEAREDPDVAVVVLNGKGRAFSVGQDMADMAQIGQSVQGGDAHGDREVISGFPGLLDAVEVFDKPLLAGVNGLGVGLGFTILAHCDLVVMADDARLRAPFCPLGVAPEAASSVLFVDRMGWQNAAWVLLSGDWVDANQARDLGIAWKVVPSADLLDVTMDAAQQIAQWPIPSLVATKRAMLDGRADRVRRARSGEDAAFEKLIGSPANIEAVMAFLEKRTPDFSQIDGA